MRERSGAAQEAQDLWELERDRLAVIRDSFGLNNQTLASLCGLSHSPVYRMFSDKNYMPPTAKYLLVKKYLESLVNS